MSRRLLPWLLLLCILPSCKGGVAGSDARSTTKVDEEEYAGTGEPNAVSGVNLVAICVTAKDGTYTMDCDLSRCEDSSKSKCTKLSSTSEIAQGTTWKWGHSEAVSLLGETAVCAIRRDGLGYHCESTRPITVTLSKKDKTANTESQDIAHSFTLKSIASNPTSDKSPLEFTGLVELKLTLVWQDRDGSVTSAYVSIGETVCASASIDTTGNSIACTLPKVTPSGADQLLDLKVCLGGTCTTKTGAFKLLAKEVNSFAATATATSTATPTPSGSPSLKVTVTGLPAAHTLIVRDAKGGSTKRLTFTTNTTQTFATSYSNAESYIVVADKQPADYKCLASSNTGTISGATTITYSCIALPVRSWTYSGKLDNCLSNANGPFMAPNNTGKFSAYWMMYPNSTNKLSYSYRTASGAWSTATQYGGAPDNSLAIGANEVGAGFLLTNPNSDSGYLNAVPISNAGLIGSPTQYRISAVVVGSTGFNIAVNLSGDAIAVLGDSTAAKAVHYSATNGSFGSTLTLGTMPGTIDMARVAIGPDGNAVAVFHDVGNKLYAYTYTPSGGWSAAATIISSNGSRHEVVMDKLGAATVLWEQAGTGIEYNRFKNNAWGGPGLIDSGASNFYQIGAAVDPDNNVFIIYDYWDGALYSFRGNRLDFGTSESPTINPSTLAEDAALNIVGEPRVVADNHGNAFAMYTFSDNNVRIAKFTAGSGWSSTTFVPGNGGNSAATQTLKYSIGFDDVGNATAAYTLAVSSNCEVHYSTYE